ncbi:carboxymuconolactone decarboxylase family protein [Bacillus sp. ISL-39]|uniref:carboxymuconolactone decarboxylase family protein n=1 Tax=Bacillus sp. ISL-39 TaxID=2819124 RepID=UPI001BECB171|nr:carboxymuconolactone decarboxylase family protein [Bacillus sp. ISL-39]MBT2639705.1 carboxymuconolactone decarboxylase family protein [Bacillus sp. ISL-39]
MDQVLYKNIYSVKEGYLSLNKGLRTARYLSRAKRKKLMTSQFIERIMLAVTEVNGCEVCSYAHTKIALEQGMSNEEIQMLLSGTAENIPRDEMPAILFAQHYADTRGNPTEESWKRIVDVYGQEKAWGILAAIRMIMIGNVFGIPLSGLRTRLKGKPSGKTNVFYELSMILSFPILFPPALLHGLILNALKKPVIEFS